MSKAGKIFLFTTLTVGLGLTACKQDKHSSVLGKWYSNGFSELWIDDKYIFMGHPEDNMAVIFKYKIKQDSIFFYNIFDTLQKGRRPAPQKISVDKVVFYNGDCFECKDTLNRIVEGVPVIDSSSNWRMKALKEIADRRELHIKFGRQ